MVGFFGTASTSETMFGCLEYLPVILALIIWAVFPPSRFLDRARGLEASHEPKRLESSNTELVSEV